MKIDFKRIQKNSQKKNIKFETFLRELIQIETI